GESSALGLAVRALRARVGSPREDGRGAARLPEVQEPLLEPAPPNQREKTQAEIAVSTWYNETALREGGFEPPRRFLASGFPVRRVYQFRHSRLLLPVRRRLLTRLSRRAG